jgi:glycosyltransferase involved in cell wall biosynthesis
MSDKQTIFINGRFLTQKITGVQRYAYELISSLDAELAAGTLESHGFVIKLLVPPGTKNNLDLKFVQTEVTGARSGQIWEQCELPIRTKGCLLFTPCGGAPILHRHHVYTIHDASVYATPKAFSWIYRIWYRAIFQFMASRAKQILTVSEFSKQEISKYLRIEPKRIIVTHLSGEHICETPADENILQKFGLIDKIFILAVSSLNPNKNFDSIVKAISILQEQNVYFAIAGGMNSKIFGSSHRLPSNVIKLGYIRDDELRALYQSAKCFIFPSLYEGFGIPILEAMKCSCPVIAANTASIPEVAADGALYCDPQVPQTIAEQIKKIISDSSLCSSLMISGRRQANKFRWSETARKTWQILTSVASSISSDGKINI